MGTRGTNSRGVKTLDTVFGIIEAVEELDGAGVTELADHLGLAKSTVHSHVTSLFEKEYLIRDGDEYNVGLRFLKDGAYAKSRHDRLLDAADPGLHELAERTEETVWLEVEEHGYAVCLEVIMGAKGITTGGREGSRFLMHSGSAGKSMLAHLDDEYVEAILGRHGLPAFTERTITTREELYDELETVGEQGYGFSRGESHPGINTVGVPILVDREVRGAIVVSGPRNRLRGARFEEEIPELLLATSNEVELRLSFG